MATPRLDEAAIFNGARQIATPEARLLYLQNACVQHPERQARIEALLRVHDLEPSFLESPTGEFAAAVAGPVAVELSTHLGPYKLLRKIGEGGMGAVFLGEQSQPVQRQVAVKIVRPGMDSQRVLARFEAERQALALMDHPNIAKVLDAGATGTTPYFVMELVHGVPITKFCDDERLTPRQRLELFIPMCQAVQHAHQKGIIDRDLKPSNVLVARYDDKPVPKIIDFGIAKAIGPRVPDASQLTDFGSVIGTLEYMSPEQAEPGTVDIDTRSDIYSLGALLYELLTGTTPLQPTQLQGVTLPELLRIVREEEPPRPSTRLSTTEELPAIAANRSLDPGKLRSLVRGDLDWIVMKCLEKDRTRRYETANALARDLERYLDDEPVEACPPSAGYRLRKFARKHRRPLAAGSVCLFLLLLGAAVSTWQAVRATAAEGLARESERQALADRDDKERARQEEAEQRRQADTQRKRAITEKQRADEQAAVALAVNDFLAKLLGQADIANQVAGGQRNRNISVRELLDRAARGIDTKFKGQPRTEAAIRFTLGKAYRALAEYPAAQRHLERSLALRQKHLGADHVETLEAMHELGMVHLDREHYDDAETLVKRALEGFRAQREANHADVLTAMQNLAGIYRVCGRYDLAEPLYKEALNGSRLTLDFDHFTTLATMRNLADMYLALGRYDEAEPLYKDVLKLRRARLGGDHTATLNSIHDLARMNHVRGRFDDAERLYQQALELRRATLVPNHPDTLESMNGLASLWHQRGRYDQAEALYQEVVEARRAKLGADHTTTLNSINNLACLYRDRGRLDEAETLFKQVLAGFRAKLGPDHQRTLAGMNNVAMISMARERYDEAEPLLKQVQQRLRAQLSATHPDTLQSMYNLAYLYLECARYDEAEPIFKEVFDARRARYGPDHLTTFASLNSLALIHHGRGELDKAEPLFLQVLQARRDKLGADHHETMRSMNYLALLYRDRGRDAEAAPLFAEAVTHSKKQLGLGHRETQRYVINQADLYSKQGKPDLAEAQLRELAAFLHDTCGQDSVAHAGQLGRLAQNLFEQKKYAEAESTARDSLTILARKEPEDWTTFRTQSLLGGALAGQKKYADAEPLLLQGYAGMRRCAANTPKEAGLPLSQAREARLRLTQAGERLVHLYDAWGKAAQAADWRKKLQAANPN